MEPFKIKCTHLNYYTGERESEMVEWSLTTPGEKVSYIFRNGAKFLFGVALIYGFAVLWCAL
jgi:hypothetical protein